MRPLPLGIPVVRFSFLFLFFLKIYIYEKEGNTLGILIHKYREHFTYRVLTLALGLFGHCPIRQGYI